MPTASPAIPRPDALPAGPAPRSIDGPPGRFLAFIPGRGLRLGASVLLVSVAALGLGACTTVVREPAPPPRVVYREVPAPVIEAVPVAPGPGWSWVPGHWAWRDGGWRWAAGHYVQQVVPPMPPVIVEQVTVAPSPAHVWVRGHWRWGGGGWVWTRGTWVLG